MTIDPKLGNGPLPFDKKAERRSKPRIHAPFPVRVRGVDASGEAFEIDTALDNISAGGLYVRLPRQIDVGAKLFVVVRLSTIPVGSAPAMRVAARGIVLRAEPQPDNSYGLAVEFTSYRFL